MPVFTPELRAQIKEVITAIHANNGMSQLTAEDIEKRLFPNGDIVDAIKKYKDDITAQLEIMFYILTESD